MLATATGRWSSGSKTGALTPSHACLQSLEWSRKPFLVFFGTSQNLDVTIILNMTWICFIYFHYSASAKFNPVPIWGFLIIIGVPTNHRTPNYLDYFGIATHGHRVRIIWEINFLSTLPIGIRWMKPPSHIKPCPFWEIPWNSPNAAPGRTVAHHNFPLRRLWPSALQCQPRWVPPAE